MYKHNQDEIDLIYLQSVFHDHLLRGDASILIDETFRCLNAIGMRLYNIPKLEGNDPKCLKYLLMICNVLYNRTDMEVLPIEDGFYDLLLEKYKEYDSNFQVGSAVVQFKDKISRSGDYKETTCPIYILPEHKPKNEMAQMIWDDITRNGKPIYNNRDLVTSPIYYTGDPISKRTHNTAHNHPQLVGTLDKCKFVLIQDAIDAGVIDDPNVKILERDFFGKHIQQGIISPNQELELVLELKYDGISVEADCNSVLLSARTRGDTGIGEASDITPILEGYPFKHAGGLIGERPLGVKFEAIITKTAMSEFCKVRQYNYVNCRTAIIGLFGLSDGYKYRDYITLVPLALDRDQVPGLIPDRVAEIKVINELFRSNGEPLRYCVVKGNVQELLYWTKLFLDEAREARDYLNFMYDGIVVSYRDETIRAKLGRENFINKYSMAVKFNPLTKTTTFRGYTYEVGQNGTITPMIHYDPVEFLGTIHTKSTGSSLARFLSLGLRYGDHIDVTYRNDVMPYVTKPDNEYNRANTNPVIEPPTKCPICGADIAVSDSGKTMYCTNMNCKARKIGRIVNMLAKLNLKGFGDSMIQAIDKYTLRELINLDMNYLGPRIGEGNAANFIELMNRLKTEPIYDYIIFGALGFSGIASKTWKLIFSKIDYRLLMSACLMDEIYEFVDEIISIPGIGDSTFSTIAMEYKYYDDDIEFILNMPNVVSCKTMAKPKKQIRFSGCRNLQLEQQLCKAGYDADSSSGVTKQTDILIVPYEGYSSTKTKKMEGHGVIVPIDKFMINKDLYLN